MNNYLFFHASRRTACILGTALFALSWGPGAVAQGAWPEKAIRVIVPYPPGGPSDIVLRIVAQKMQVVLKQPIVVDNKPGAGGNLGTAEAARAAPDGYTWLWATDNVVTVNPHVYAKLSFRPKDLVPVSIASTFSQTLVCNPEVGVKNVGGLIVKAKASRLSYASGGAGAPGHLAMELLMSQAGIEMQHVPYRGPAPAMQDIMGGQVPCGFLAGPTVLPHVKSGRLVALAVSGHSRSIVLPDVPTVAESGLTGYDATFSLVLFAPRGTPRPIIDKLRTALVGALQQPDTIDKLKVTDQTVMASSSAEAAERLASDASKWGAVAKHIQLKLD